MAKELTEKQLYFLEYLFGAAKGDVSKAKVMAGYAKEYSNASLIKSLEEEILERTKRYLLQNGAKAVLAMEDVLDDPTQLGVQHKVAVAKDLLDRIGVVKTEKIEVNPGVFILPPKGDE